ncbi:hypothetical protein MSAN_00602900 [Mycena sanguinolenta]|uniref:Uncharacterized protein n=1 Tax=Mycena sanguinolenta TaxID=230812 RepID=A0A8H6Z7E0_9AGAR|nr:hypothetical protein MSAN_00602900 [Mycena sanguinolenta]
MKRKQVSSEEADPGLNNGAAFFSEVHTYMEHKSRCVSHDAVNQPDRDSRGTASSGIGTVDCARHNMKRPNGVGDLQKGERYINMDYMLWKSLVGYDDLIQLIVSYDIVCQWSINIWRRLAEYKPELKERAGTGYRYWVWLIPKFHLPAHIEACNILYSFDLSPYVAQTDGEAPERGWANANPLAASTREMGPGARRDILDDHFNDWNHKKIVALGRVMLERIQKAVAQMMEKQEDLVEMEASLPLRERGKLDDRNRAEKHATLQAVRKRIAEETKDAVEGDRADDVRGDLHVSEMLAMGMQLESQQRDLASDSAALKTHAKIANWVRMQTEFQPDVARLRERDDLARAESAKTQPTVGVSVEALELWLPSKQARTPGVVVKQSHARYEFDMREARAYEALEEIRRLLLVRTHHYKFKDRNVSGVSGHTRSRQAIAVLDERIRREAGEYHAAPCACKFGSTVGRDAMVADIKRAGTQRYSGDASWVIQRAGQEATEEEEAPRQEQDEQEPVEMSWIWRTGLTSLAAAASTSEEAAVKATNESLRVEWAKTRARAHRWTEEVDLLEEEMRRILVFLQWRADWWREQKDRRVVDEVEMKEGFAAYAERQAAIQEEMKARFTNDWKDVGRWIALGRQGVADFKERARIEMEGKSDDDERVATDDESYEPVPSLPGDGAMALVEASLLSAA